MKKIFLIFASFLLASQAINAQSKLGFGLQLGVPMNEFRENTQATGVGINLNFYTPFAPRVPVFMGFNFGYMLYGSYTQQVNENLQLTTSNGTPIGQAIPVNLDVTTNNNMLNGNVAFRVMAPFANIKPYAEAIGGFNYLYTRTSIYDRTSNRMFTSNQESALINARTQAQSFVLQYGAGAGFLIKIGENVNLDIRGTYTIGGRAEYFDRSQSQQWRVSFTGQNYTGNEPVNLNTSDGVTKKSNTDLFLINFGLSFNL